MDNFTPIGTRFRQELTAEFKSGAGDPPPRRQNGLRPAALTELESLCA